jgi:hypothetical protein
MAQITESALTGQEEQMVTLLREILGDAAEQALDDPEKAIQLALEVLQKQRLASLRSQQQLAQLRASRSFRLVRALAQLRQVVAPSGSWRAWAGRVVWRTLRDWGVRPILRATSRTAPLIAQTNPQIEALRQRCGVGQDLYIFLPSVPWTLHLFQRPQHLARHLARQGAIVVYDCSGTDEDISGLVEREPGLFLFKGAPELLTTLPDPILWTFTYNFPQRGAYPASCRVVYDWIDDLSVFPYDQAWLQRCHDRALAEADLVVSVARPLHELALQQRPDAVYLPNAADFDHFNQPLPAVSDPALARLVADGRPIAGYYGALASWFDYDLLHELAQQRPDWNFVLIGPDYDGSILNQPLLRQSNVTWVGPRPYAELPQWLAQMSCALIPFQLNDITHATSPLKLYEYFSGGKPVIATAMPECLAHPEVQIVDCVEAFSRELDVAQEKGKDAGFVAQLRHAGRANSWSSRVQTVRERMQAGQKIRQLPIGKSRRFARALWAHFAPHLASDCFGLWYEYALTTNERGKATATTLQRYGSLQGKDYLDVGCAYGGFLVAFGQHGARVQGMDVDPALLKLAQVNLTEQRVKAPLHQLDATGSEMARFHNSLDVITCNDVIEHVDDPEALVRNLANSLRPGGLLYLEIPNKDYPPYIVEDGHFRLFGITLLDHDDARAYYAALYPDNPYTVGHYLTLDAYGELLARYGLRMELLEQCVEFANAEVAWQSVQTLEAQGQRLLQRVPPIAREKVRRNLAEYLREVRTFEGSSEEARRAFLLRYGISFWQVLARKQ